MIPVLRLAGTALAVTTAFASAQPPSPTPSVPAAAGQCAGCHGAQGEGNGAAGFPRIAGQSQNYLAKQLDDYASRRRRNNVMEPIARGLSAADRTALAAYYAKIEAPPSAHNAAADNGSGGRARALAVTGDGQRRVQACNNCHGPDGIGEPPLIPYISGLDAKYLEATLRSWRTGTRDNDRSQQMPMIAKALAEEDIPALAQYYAGLQPPKPMVAAVHKPTAAAKAANTGGKSPVGTAVQGGASTKGVGQGAATSGGSQGPGGSNDSRSEPTRRQ
jgi:cytochrome c553